MFWSTIRPPAEPQSCRVGRLMIDRGERAATLAGKPLDLSPLLFQLLLCLVEHPGIVVSRARLKSALWPYAERIDTERRLNTAMRALRAALSDDAECPRYIETVRSHGYRWIGGGTRSREQGVSLFAIAAASLFAVIVVANAPERRSVDITATLRAQAAMDEWRARPSANSSARAAALIGEARDRSGESAALLTMKAEFELGGRWDWKAAERDYQLALTRDPANADARLGLAWLKANQGRTGESFRLVTALLRDGVLAGDRRSNLGWLLIRIGRPDLAAENCAGSDRSFNRLSCSHTALAALGRYDEARAIAAQLMIELAAETGQIARVRQQRAREGYASFLEWRARHFLPTDAPHFQRAQVLADAGYSAEALGMLAKSIAAHEPLAVKIASTPSFERMRSEPRYQALLRQVGLGGSAS